MTFEDDFPSLKEYSIFYELECIDEIKTYLQNHCLDKQKVKEAIEKYNFQYDDKAKLLTELGLK